MTYNEALQLINQYIVTNGNNEITAAVLNPVLEAMLEASEDTTGLLENLETEANENLVAAINELKAMIPEGATGTPVNFHFGEANPNTTPPASFKPGDNYWQSVGGNPVQLWVYNGFSWVQFGSGGGGGTSTPMKTAEVHFSALGAASLEEVTPEMCNAWLEANYTEADRLGFLLEVTDEVAPSFSFDVRANWAIDNIDDEASFSYKLASMGYVFTLSDFAMDGDRITANVASSATGASVNLSGLGITEISALNLPGVSEYDLNYNDISSVNAAALSSNIEFLWMEDNALTEAAVNAMLEKLDSDITDGAGRMFTFHGGTSAVPTGAGLAAKNSLITKAATVVTN